MGWHDHDRRARREFLVGLAGLGAFVGVLLLGALVVWVLGQQGGQLDLR